MARPLEPVSLTPETENKILTALRAGSYLETAAAFAGVDEGTLFGWLRRGAREYTGKYYNFWKACDQAMAHAEIRDIGIIASAAQKGIWKAAAWRLERKHPERWASRKVIHMGSMDDMRSAEIDLAQFSDRELDALEALLKKGKPREPEDAMSPA